MIEQLQEALQKIAAADKIKLQIGQALTRPQQLAISARLRNGLEPLVLFIQTDEGRAAIRQLADTFIKYDKE